MRKEYIQKVEKEGYNKEETQRIDPYIPPTHEGPISHNSRGEKERIGSKEF